MRSPILLFLFFLFVTPAVAADVTYPVAPLDIQSHGTTLHFTVEVATSEAQHEQGLMFRTKVPDLHGMIFIFPKLQPVTFWMKNTLVPLDMLFVDNAGIITQIVEKAKPKSLDLIASERDTRAVIEVAGGAAAHYHLAPGDKVIYPLFAQ